MKHSGMRAKALLILLGGLMIIAPPTLAEDPDLEDLEELFEEFEDDLEDRIEKLIAMAAAVDEKFEEAAEKLEKKLLECKVKLTEIDADLADLLAEIEIKYADYPDLKAAAIAKANADADKDRKVVYVEIEKAEAEYKKQVLAILALEGEINPTNVAVTDIDVEFSCMLEQPAAGQIEAVEAHTQSRGAGVMVAVLDGGFNLNAPSIRDHVLPFGYDSVDLDFDVEDFGNGIDDYGDGVVDNAVGHGTFVSSMIVMAAPDAWILPVRVVDDEGFGTDIEIAEGIWFAIAMGANVINISIENGTDSSLIESAVRDAEAAGITVVVSSGDGAHGDLGVLAEMTETISVGAVDGFDCLADFTNYEQGVLDIVAPGVELYGPFAVDTDDQMCLWSGSSFSAALVSGGAALLLEQNAWMPPWQVKSEMKAATDDAYGTDGTLLPDTGRLNLRKVAER